MDLQISSTSGLYSQAANGDDDKPSYQGSQAYNSSLFTAENVNSQTGTLTMGKSLIARPGVTSDIDLNLNLTYSSSAANIPSVLGLPKGWSYQLSYVIPANAPIHSNSSTASDNPITSVNINGQNYIYDDSWHDVSGYYSGLRYINNHSIKFERISGVVPWDNTLKYSYRYSDKKSGITQYFDLMGKLLGETNRYGLYITYKYLNDSANVYHTKLKEIDDSYKQVYNIGNPSGGKILISDSQGKQLSSVDIGVNGVTAITDIMGYHTKYSYKVNPADASSYLVNRIEYPSGLVTAILYNTIPYVDCNSRKNGSLPVVSILTHAKSNSTLDNTKYTYGGGNATFTGYPAICMSNLGDNLTDYPSYQYLVTITKINPQGQSQEDRLTYNYLHLLVEQDSDSTGANGVHKAKLYTYDIKSSSAKARSPSFSEPVNVTTKVGDKVIGIESSSYNSYDEPTSIMYFGIMDGSLKLYRSTLTSYFEAESAFYLTKEIFDKDELSGDILDTSNTLNDNHLEIKSSKISYNNHPWKTTSYGYEPDTGRIIKQTIAWDTTPPKGSPTSSSIQDSYSYNSSDGILTDTQTDARGYQTIITRDTKLSGSPILTSKNPLGKVTTHTYDLIGRELSVTSPGGNHTSTSYKVAQKDQGSNQVTKTDPLGHTTIIDYDELARPIQVSDNGGNNKTTRILETDSYNQLGQVVIKTDIFGNSVHYTYDEFGRVRTTTDSLNNVVTNSYDDANLTKISELNGVKSSTEVSDGAGNIVSVTKYSAEDSGAKQHTTVETNTYNGFKEKILSTTTTDGVPIKTTTTTFNGDGDAEQSNSTLSDGSNGDAEVDSNSIKDLLGKPLTTTTTINGKATKNGYQNTYDATGLLETSSNSMGDKTMSYYPDGNLETLTNYDETVTSYTYDADGHPITKTKNGITFKMDYDANGNVKSITNSSNPNNTIMYEYSNTNLLKSVTYPDGKSVIYTYYDNGLVKSKTNALGVTTNYEEDNHGRMKSITTNGSVLTYNYDDNNKNIGKYGTLMSVTLNNGVTTTHTYSYDGWGNIASDEVTEGSNKTTISYKKDLLQRTKLQQITSTLPSSNLNLTKTYQYDALSHLKEATTVYNNRGNSLYASNGLSVLPESVTEIYSYDTDGNVTTYTNGESTTTYSYNNKDQIESINGYKIAYDVAGNMKNDATGNTYSYNSLNQLESVRSKDNIQLSKYDYYPDGLLSNKQSSDNSLLSFYYDNGNIDGITSLSNLNKLSATNFMLDAGGKVVASFDDAGSNSYSYLTAGNSTIGMLDESGGLSNSFNYSAYGVLDNESTISATKSFLWDGEYNDSDTGLVYLRARFYNPKLMRFMNADTVDVANLYNFGDGDPINNIDPSGHFSLWDGILIGFSVAAIFATDGVAAAPVAAVDAAAAVAPVAAAEAADAAEAAIDIAAQIPATHLNLIPLSGDPFSLRIPQGAVRLSDIPGIDEWDIINGVGPLSKSTELSALQDMVNTDGVIEVQGIRNRIAEFRLLVNDSIANNRVTAPLRMPKSLTKAHFQDVPVFFDRDEDGNLLLRASSSHNDPIITLGIRKNFANDTKYGASNYFRRLDTELEGQAILELPSGGELQIGLTSSTTSWSDFRVEIQ